MATNSRAIGRRRSLLSHWPIYERCEEVNETSSFEGDRLLLNIN